MADLLMSNGSASSLAYASHDASRARIDRRVGLASAENVVLRWSGIDIALIPKHSVFGSSNPCAAFRDLEAVWPEGVSRTGECPSPRSAAAVRTGNMSAKVTSAVSQ